MLSDLPAADSLGAAAGAHRDPAGYGMQAGAPVERVQVQAQADDLAKQFRAFRPGKAHLVAWPGIQWAELSRNWPHVDIRDS
jgi:hypothetical protein